MNWRAFVVAGRNGKCGSKEAKRVKSYLEKAIGGGKQGGVWLKWPQSKIVMLTLFSCSQLPHPHFSISSTIIST